MLTKRVIACLDVDAGRVVKGTRFTGLRDMGDPVELAVRYEDQGADEIVFLDITATVQARPSVLDLVRRTAERLFVPLTLGGGVRTADDMAAALRAGADKVSVNSAIVTRPELLTECAERFGAQCVVASVDARRDGGGWRVVTHGGRRDTGLDAVAWCAECAARGAGEILLTSIDADGARSGYDAALVQAVGAAVRVPVVASGGAGEPAHASAVLAMGADAALVAGVLHEGCYTIGDFKERLAADGLPVRATRWTR